MKSIIYDMVSYMSYACVFNEKNFIPRNESSNSSNLLICDLGHFYTWQQKPSKENVRYSIPKQFTLLSH